MLSRDQKNESRLIKINFLFRNLFLISGGFNLVIFLAINSDAPLTRPEKLQPSNLVKKITQNFFLYGALLYAVM